MVSCPTYYQVFVTADLVNDSHSQPYAGNMNARAISPKRSQ